MSKPAMNARPPKRKMEKGVMGRAIKLLFKYYPKMMTFTLIFIIVNAIISAIPSVFMKSIFTVVEKAITTGGGWAEYGGEIIKDMLILIGLYVVSLTMGAVDKQLMAVITQGFLKKMRQQMFNGMQNLPIKYFDTNKHGDIMSYYTNDIDALRQMISQSLPQLLTSSIMVLTLFIIMIWYSLWLTLIVLTGVIFIFIVTKIVGGGAGKYFLGAQRAMGKTEGFIEEMMNGQKVVKVFCHESAAK
ncbi:MAG: ABC transporter ATP-binding protein, partial [Clostridiales bacterium]|nr:ABC transporter ATP-binding protein [Clostridiales bacterium]